MKKLGNNEMKNITGGGISFGVVAAIVAGITFVTGILDGILRPLRCHEWES